MVGSVQDLAPMGDVVLHQILVQWVGDPYHADERESGGVLYEVVDFG